MDYRVNCIVIKLSHKNHCGSVHQSRIVPQPVSILFALRLDRNDESEITSTLLQFLSPDVIELRWVVSWSDVRHQTLDVIVVKTCRKCSNFHEAVELTHHPTANRVGLHK